MDPPPPLTISGKAYFEQQKMLRKLISIRLSQSAAGVSTKVASLRPDIPALFIRISSRP
jgi:hypothetical protein